MRRGGLHPQDAPGAVGIQRPRRVPGRRVQLLEDMPGALDATPPELDARVAAEDALPPDEDDAAAAALEDRLAVLAATELAGEALLPVDVATLLLPPEELPTTDADEAGLEEATLEEDVPAALEDDDPSSELASPPDEELVFTPPVVGGTGHPPSTPRPRPRPATTMTA